MFKVNDNYLKLPGSYLFSTIAKKVNAFTAANPQAEIIRLGIGDVTQPIAPAVIEALHKAVDEQTTTEGFKGYAPDLGYAFLRETIAKNDYEAYGCDIAADEIFVSDGAKSDSANIQEIFSLDNKIAVCDPVYPVYVDTNTMDGKKIIYMNGTEENDFLPMPDDKVKADIIYLCSPNNPTGACYNKEQLEAWVAYALKNDAVILYDSAYEAFITDPTLPRSIYAIEGAKKCAIEFCSLSKTAGFTGTRFSYTVVPEELVFETSNGGTLSLHNMWNRRQCTKFNGTPYIIQYAGAKVFTEEGMKECQENIGYYRENAHMIAETLEKKGISFTGGVNSPYIWFECPKGMESWEFFDYLLENAQIVGTPGAGFGENGKNYFRLTSFGKHEKTKEAMERFNALF